MRMDRFMPGMDHGIHLSIHSPARIPSFNPDEDKPYLFHLNCNL